MNKADEQPSSTLAVEHSPHRTLPIPSPEVKVGQVWESMDNRLGRKAKFEIIVAGTGAWWACVRYLTGEANRTGHIRRSRLRPIHNGYRLVKDVP